MDQMKFVSDMEKLENLENLKWYGYIILNDWNWKKEKICDKEVFLKFKPRHYYQNILKNSKFISFKFANMPMIFKMSCFLLNK